MILYYRDTDSSASLVLSNWSCSFLFYFQNAVCSGMLRPQTGDERSNLRINMYFYTHTRWCQKRSQRSITTPLSQRNGMYATCRTVDSGRAGLCVLSIQRVSSVKDNYKSIIAHETDNEQIFDNCTVEHKLQ